MFTINTKNTNKKGTTFVELLLYISIFLIITPVLLTVSINSAREESAHVSEKQVNSDSQFMVERIYDYINQAKRVDVANTTFDEADGRLSLIMQDDSNIVVRLNPATKRIEVTEDGQTSDLSSSDSEVESLYFQRITGDLNDPDIVLGINVRINIKGSAQYDKVQNYVTSANLERGDYDEDGCPDYMDTYPKHAECCGDSDGDGICDELDNCVLEFNPFQEDFDTDEIGDVCDDNVYLGEGGDSGGSGLFGAFNCSADSQLITLLHQDPPLASATLKQILISSSPLPPTVLHEIIVTNPLMTSSDFRQVFYHNVKLPTDIKNELMSASSVSTTNKILIAAADLIATFIPWVGNTSNTTNYQVAHLSEMCGSTPPQTEYVDTIKFSNSTSPLGPADLGQNSDIFIITVNDGNTDVTVTTQTASGTDTSVLNGAGSSVTDNLGFLISLESITGNNYAFTVNSIGNTESLVSVTFNFGCGAGVISPSSTYTSSRYACYCEGGCADNCGDGGTGILTNNIYTDRCYRVNWLFPEWCSKWETFKDDNSANPAYMGGTKPGEDTAYWEKTFKTMLTQTQLNNLQSITVGAEVAYQSTAQFFCDTLASQCPMKGDLIGDQDISLYNYQTASWDVIGHPTLNGDTSDQQAYEVKYSGPNPLKYVGGSEMKARMEFHWEGIPPVGQTSAPSFMLIDYFTLHLKW